MKQTLVIGSTVVDVILKIPFLPGRGEDVNITGVEYRIGGCAYNVYRELRNSQSPALLCSPVGSGIYGAMVREHFEKEAIVPFVSLKEENGCCYCLAEEDGERTFLSHHGAEYLFSSSWTEKLDFSKAGEVFICGLEIEEPSGIGIIDFVFRKPELELFFSPGPRIMHIPRERMEKLLQRRDKAGRGPVLHLNEREALAYSGKPGVEEGAGFLYAKTGNIVVVTLGERGSYCLSEKGGAYIPAFPVKARDTTGAGDAHCGALIACLKKGLDPEAACHEANRAAAKALS